MLHYFSTEEIKDYQLFFPDGGDLTLPYLRRAIKDIGTPLGAYHLDLKKLYRITALKYRLKWKLVTPSGNTTGVDDTSYSANQLECINLNFRNTLSRDAGSAVSIGDIDLPQDDHEFKRAGMVLNRFGAHTFLLADTSVLKPVWPLAFTFTVADFDEVDVRGVGAGGEIYAVRGSRFAGLSPSHGGAHHGSFKISPDSPVGGDFTRNMNTDIAAESSNPALYPDASFYGDPATGSDTDGSGTTLFYKEFWQIVQG